MRVLLLHNRYRAEGGEERALGEIAALLARRGHVVEVLERTSAGVSRARAARGLLAGGLDPVEVSAAVRRLRADVVHAHNVHPLFGWRALAAARAAGARTVLHVHNFRMFCAIAVAYRDGAPCFRCHGAHTLPGLRLRCRGNVVEAALYAAALHNQQGPLFAHVDRFIAVSEATARRLIELGLPKARTVSIANFVAAGAVASRSRAHEGEYALVAGRLVEEKGFDTAIRACRTAGVPLVVAGEGPDMNRLRQLAAGGEVKFAGWLAPDRLEAVRRRAAVVLAPSRWEEPCPYAVLDALAAGVPALVSERGGLPELAGEQSVVPAEDLERWTSALEAHWRAPAARRCRGEEALARVRERFSEDVFHDAVVSAYGGD